MVLQDLSNYISAEENPKFSEYINKNMGDIVKLAVNGGVPPSPADLYSTWKKAFLTEMRRQGKALNITAISYNKNKWQGISELIKAAETTKLQVETEAMRSIGSAARSARELLGKSFDNQLSPCNDGDSSGAPSIGVQDPPSTGDQEAWSTRDHHNDLIELILHKATYQKLGGKTLSEDDKAFLVGMTSIGGSLKNILYATAAKKLLQERLDPVDEEHVKLCVSRIINLIHPDMANEITNALGDLYNTLDLRSIIVDLEPATCESFDNLFEKDANGDIIFSAASLDSLLVKLCARKGELIKIQKVSTQEYQMLLIVEQVVNNFGLEREPHRK
ncbi:hypothetical protein DFQ28_010190 [Apophysomyces sp. BC1034]|nr:hypothetical protein DFQ30_002305 [Apophysomyces sp. BC1015]KAG0171679.1 hypothetical protein DFQ29_008717 [Apophysomyces sp. BC1021]KAG0184958.1 hypothetical protein DFQ28_010190 [Apophysomyces sp. BC1034]